MANILQGRDDRLVAAIIAIVAIVAVVALVYVFGLGRPATSVHRTPAYGGQASAPAYGQAPNVQAPTPTASSDAGVAVTQAQAPTATPPQPPPQAAPGLR